MPNRGKGKGKGKKPHRKPAPPPPDNPTHPIRMFPREILINILSRLPVKTLLRFRSVSKQWRTLISSSKFISAHLTRSKTNLYFNTLPEYQLVGSVNGVVCMTQPPWAHLILLYNPITGLEKAFSYPDPTPNPNIYSMVSVGMAYDPRTDNYIIILIHCYHQWLGIRDRPVVYSWRNGWMYEVVELGLEYFRVMGTSCDAVIGGVPYWRAKIKDALGELGVLVYYDVEKGVFGSVSLPWVMDGTDACVGEFRGALGMVVWPKTEGTAARVFDVWTMDDEEGWSKKYSVGPIAAFDRVLSFGIDGSGIIVKDGEGKVFEYEFENGDCIPIEYGFESSQVGDCIPIQCSGPGTVDVVLIKESLVFPIDVPI